MERELRCGTKATWCALAWCGLGLICAGANLITEITIEECYSLCRLEASSEFVACEELAQLCVDGHPYYRSVCTSGSSCECFRDCAGVWSSVNFSFYGGVSLMLLGTSTTMIFLCGVKACCCFKERAAKKKRKADT